MYNPGINIFMKDVKKLSTGTLSKEMPSHSPLNEFLEYKIEHIPLKRIFDIVFSLFMLIILSPLFIVLSSVIFCTSPGKIIYSHHRIGRGGRFFKCYKFRSMYPRADEHLKEILSKNSELRIEWEKSFKLKKDPRITPFGRFLRKSSFDELPQFWNVLKGDLSVVGPRPVVQEEVHKYMGEKAIKILSIRPGLTGLWQVSARSDISCYKERIKLDEFYVDNRSLALDIKLIAKTIPVMLFSKGAY